MRIKLFSFFLFFLFSALIAEDTCLYISVNMSNPKFSVKLPSNPSTGYRWYLDSKDYSEITQSTYSFKSSESKLVGSSGEDVFSFLLSKQSFNIPKALKLRFYYLRSWESKIEDTKDVLVLLQPA